MDKKPKSAAEITLEMIEAWKKANPKGVHKITVEDKVGYIRHPNRNDLKYALTMVQQGGELGMIEAVLEDIWLGGDIELKEDDDYFFGASHQVRALLQVKNGSLEKL